MAVPQRLTFVTLGARDLTELRRFYGRLGWEETDDSGDSFACFDCEGTFVALYPLDLLRAEAAPDAAPVPADRWNGVTLAVNVGSPARVDAMYADALSAGATPVAPPTPRAWGGYSGYVADPEGNRWELAWAPGLEP